MDSTAQALKRMSILSGQIPAQAATHEGHLQLGMQPCAAGDSAPYERRSSSLDDVVIVAALRTPLTKAKRGGLRNTDATDLMATVFKAVLDKTSVDPKRANEARIASFFAGIPEEVPVRTVNRQCSSGLQAVADVAAAIKAGYYTVGLAAGVETMSINPMAWEGGINPKIGEVPKAQGCMMPMGVTSENVASKFGIDRKTQDAFSVRSHQRAAAARAAGKFKDEIVPVHTKVVDPKTGATHTHTHTEDDGIRPDHTHTHTRGLRPVFKKDGSTTAGNSSQVSNTAARMAILGRGGVGWEGPRLEPGTHAQPPRTSPCHPPNPTNMKSCQERRVLSGIMSWTSFLKGQTGAVWACPANLTNGFYRALKTANLKASYSVATLGLDPSKVNPNGGAIALGHPLGATGARCTATLLHEMHRRGRAARFGVVSMCIGSGMGAAAVFEVGPETDPVSNARPSDQRMQSHLSRDAVL
ncbi:Thiolase, N-terminal domain-containing protein [Dunaliella salina]|uniref:acetyl-CoA C-acyltransferase n=1 Tax=Dunaliella salina TaxID=3046 RepID=A0ABQ7H8Y3_DUNSA|nr:Thiolase, N-terminal domain-containing protein [Dunaliella salina]|eukprot:KAF5843309.1 Thiolase, N-terminal domain-containing protein [Dunaliella salina]